MVDNSDLVYNGISLYKLTESAYNHYRLGTKDNADISFEEARRKITRNIKMSIVKSKWKSYGHELTSHYYGSLQIITRGDLVIRIKRGYKPNPEYVFHKRKYEKLTKRLDLVK